MVTKKQELLKSVEYMDTREAIAHIQSFRKPFLRKPAVPVLGKNPTREEVDVFKRNLDAWLLETEDYDKLDQEYEDQNNEIQEALKELLIERSEARTYVPEEKLEKVFNFAWDNGHSSGWESVYDRLEEVVEVFK